MTRTQYNTAVSLDGFIADEHDSLTWLEELGEDPDNTAIFEEFMDGVGAMAMGAAFSLLYPSLLLIVYGVLAEVSIGHALIGRSAGYCDEAETGAD